MTAAAAPFEIRAARPEDAPALADLLSELGFPAAVDVVARRLDSYTRAGETAIVGGWGAEVLGLATLHMTPVLHRPTPVGRMTALVVAGRARGQGLGRALVAAAERHLAGAGCALIEVTSSLELVGAHAFYARLGYEVTSLRFRKVLPPPEVVS